MVGHLSRRRDETSSLRCPACPVALLAVAPVAAARSSITCTVKRGVDLFVFGISGERSSVEDPPFFAITEADQQACARAFDATAQSIAISVGGAAVALVGPEFEVLTRQQTATLPADNILQIDPQTFTFSAHAFGAGVRELDTGPHIVT